MITKEMVVAWKNDPVTLAVMNVLYNYREEAKEYMASGATLPVDAEPSTEEVVGKCKAYEQMLTIIEDIEAEEEAK